jgi:hypothetical protein
MTEKQTTDTPQPDWSDLNDLRWRMRYALENLDSIDKRADVRAVLEVAMFRLDDLCEVIGRNRND